MRKRFYALACVGLICSGAVADYTVYQYNGSGTLIDTDTYTTSGSVPQLATATRYVDIIPSSSTANLPHITLTTGATSGSVIRVYIGEMGVSGGPMFQDRASLPAPSGGDILGFTARSSTCTFVLYGAVNGSLGQASDPQNTERLSVDRLVRFDAGATWYGKAVVEQAGDPAASDQDFVCRAQSFSDKGFIELLSGNATLIEAFGITTTEDTSGPGDFKAGVDIKDGNLLALTAGNRITGALADSIKVPKGKIGRMTAAHRISQFYNTQIQQTLADVGPLIVARDGIDSIQCSYIDANITANSGTGTSVGGAIKRMVIQSTSKGIEPHVKIAATTMGGGLSDSEYTISGPFAGNITLSGSCTAPITLKRGFASTATFTVGSDGFGSQIVVNEANVGASWAGTFVEKVDSSTSVNLLDSYTPVASSIGGGAIGLVPFKMYKNDSIPAWRASTATSTCTDCITQTKFMGLYAANGNPQPSLPDSALRVPIKIAMYGPVTYHPVTTPSASTNGELKAYMITTDGASIRDITPYVEFSVDSGSPRLLQMKYKLPTGTDPFIRICAGTHKVVYTPPTATSGTAPLLRCATSGTPSAAGFDYRFELKLDCDGDGLVTTNEPTCHGTCNDLDFNNDGNIEPLDVDAYFSILGEGPCLGGTTCDSLDFNNDGNIEPEDVDAYFSVLGEGPCIDY